MKRFSSLLGVLFLVSALSVGSTAHAEEDEPLAVAFDFTYSSQYYWRGLAGGSGSFAMPSVDLSYAVSGLTVGANVWVAQGFEPDADTNNSEIDYTLYGSYAIGDIELSAGVIDYVIPLDAPFKEGQSVVEVFGGVSLGSLPFDNSITFAMNVDGDDDNSWYLAPSIGYSVDDLSFGLTLGIASESPGYYGTDGVTLIDVTPSVSYSIPFGDSEASVGLGVGINPDAKLRMPFFTFGVGWSL